MKRLQRVLAAAVLATAAFGLAQAARGEDALPPAPQRWATDSAGFLSADARQTLDNRLQQYEQSTGHQVLVWITNTSGNFTPEDFASKAFEAWRVGRKGIDDGVVLFVFADDRKLRFEVGYGLESTVTDAVAGRILRDTVVPRIQAGDRDGAIVQGIDALTAVIDGTAGGAGTAGGGSGEPTAPSAAQDQPPAQRGGHQLSTGEKIVIGLLVIGFIILLITNPSLALWLLFNLLSGGRGGGGGGGGGGFSGGGGRSGGGGASGSW